MSFIKFTKKTDVFLWKLPGCCSIFEYTNKKYNSEYGGIYSGLDFFLEYLLLYLLAKRQGNKFYKRVVFGLHQYSIRGYNNEALPDIVG